MCDWAQGPGWWQASDGRWYPPESHPHALLPPPPARGPDGRGPSHPGRRRTVLFSITGTLIVVVVIVVVVGVLVSVGGPRRTIASFVPVSPSASAQQLVDDANQLSRRLDTLGDQSDSVVVRVEPSLCSEIRSSRFPSPPSSNRARFSSARHCASRPRIGDRSRVRRPARFRGRVRPLSTP